jgi:hypothetical protein
MTTDEKCRAILEKILALCNQHEPNKQVVGFGSETPEFSLTVFYGVGHTDIKAEDFDGLITGLHALLESK